MVKYLQYGSHIRTCINRFVDRLSVSVQAREIVKKIFTRLLPTISQLISRLMGRVKVTDSLVVVCAAWKYSTISIAPCLFCVWYTCRCDSGLGQSLGCMQSRSLREHGRPENAISTGMNISSTQTISSYHNKERCKVIIENNKVVGRSLRLCPNRL